MRSCGITDDVIRRQERFPVQKKKKKKLKVHVPILCFSPSLILSLFLFLFCVLPIHQNYTNIWTRDHCNDNFLTSKWDSTYLSPPLWLSLIKFDNVHAFFLPFISIIFPLCFYNQCCLALPQYLLVSEFFHKEKKLDMFSGCEGRESGSSLLTKLGNEKEIKKGNRTAKEITVKPIEEGGRERDLLNRQYFSLSFFLLRSLQK